MTEKGPISYGDLQPDEDPQKAADYLEHRMQKQTILQKTARAINDGRLEKPSRSTEIAPGLTEYRLGSLILDIELQEPDERDEPVAKRVYLADRQAKLLENKTGHSLIISRFSLRGKNGQTLELEDISPENFSILHDPASSLNFASAENRYIFTSKPFSRPMGVLVMLHELGHCHDYDRLDDDEKAVYDAAMSHKPEDQTEERKAQRMATVLMRERNAWAFALKKLRPLIPQDEQNFWFSRKLVQSHIDSKLAEYSQGIIRRNITESY